LKVYLVWLLGVIFWNFGFPNAAPITDVVAAIILSLMSHQLKRFF